ncbi:Uncharacterized conserved protein YlxW, UPF0749 family [Quadrisphaera granulorum]|uniref:Uncharacterized protein YlxW (UPF0749 family) n=1 Tax=Quadrisphaera granulorum TaxID=317664 RepID=A0A316AEP9_9ACTN|nr:DUF881 domain-containing protein [Quadrisphaera granulorum]PWJ55748.1 uncharacterized protein YlxW (UPF0749 family) [Quadrisphaera granulorum]SZE95245.1 Uncharacterized conserved protein YlxW, UPF0749 family [Quadrisphaera granulorum]
MTYAPPGASPPATGPREPRASREPGPPRDARTARALRWLRTRRLRWIQPGSGGTLAVVVVFLLAGVLFATSARTADGTDLRASTSDLRSQVVSQEREVARADRRLAALQQEVTQLGQEVDDPAAQQLQAEADELAGAAGLDPVEGPGLVITLDDAPRAADTAAASGIAADVLIVHQQDLQAVVNALWEGGATAVGLQDQRIVSTSAVRCVGNVLRLQGRLYAPPYTVRAVGDPAALRAAVHASPAVQTYLSDVARVGLGWQLSEEQVSVPGWDGSLQLAHATVPR